MFKRFFGSNVTSAGRVSRKKRWLSFFGVSMAGSAGFVYALENSPVAYASGDPCSPPPEVYWNHEKYFGTWDRASARRGYFVYKQVCAACHSMEYVKYLEFVNEIFTEEEAKAEAEENELEDGPDMEGKMYTRKRSLLDTPPSPYANDLVAKIANNGALPPDMSFLSARLREKGGSDYIFALLTSYNYVDTPAGVVLGEGQHWNPYFPGGVISMGQQLFDGMMEYEDGTPASVAQMAKDVTTFLHFVSHAQMDNEKLLRIQALLVGPFFTGLAWMFYKYYASCIKYNTVNRFNLPFRKRK